MTVWDNYRERMSARGDTKREADRIREVRLLNRQLKESLSYNEVSVFPGKYGYNIDSDEMQKHKVTQHVAIDNTDSLNEKYICTLPGEDVEIGSLVVWMGNHWLVNERDANTTLYTKAKMVQCNHLLKWINSDLEIIEQWSILTDGTKYLTGEYIDSKFITTRGDTRIAIEVAKNQETERLNRENRFLIDDPDTPHKLAYTLSKPLKVNIYNGQGTYKFVLQEVTATAYDNHELGIAEYYRYFPKDPSDVDIQPGKETSVDENGKRVWI